MSVTDHKLKKQILNDCSSIMFFSITIYIIQESAANILAVYIANRLGNFFDSVVMLNLTEGIADVGELLLCVAAGVLLLPFIGFLGEAVMFHNALKHDKAILGRFLDKTFQSAMKMDEGEVQYRLENDPIELRGCWQDIIVDSIVTIIGVAYLLYFALPVSVWYTAVVFIVSLLRLVIPVVIQKYRGKYDRENREYKTKIGLYENLLSHWSCQIKLYRLEEKLLKRFDTIFYENYHKIRVKNISVETITNNISGFLDQICTLVILLMGTWMVSKHHITPGVIVTMIGYFGVFQMIMEKIGSCIQNFPILKNILERMEELYCDAEVTDGKSFEEDINRIETKKLQFTYDTETISEEIEENNARHIINIKYPDFVLSTGEKMEISGSNGSGKTTLLKLFCRLLDGYQGSILLNGIELREIAVEDIRKHISYIEQNPYLFQGSVLENIRIGNLDAVEEQVWHIVEELGIRHLVERNISFEKNELSGGEMQKIAIARALMKTNSIFLLDEPNNNLDAESVKWLKKFIENTSHMVIYIAHDKKLLLPVHQLKMNPK